MAEQIKLLRYRQDYLRYLESDDREPVVIDLWIYNMIDSLSVALEKGAITAKVFGECLSIDQENWARLEGFLLGWGLEEVPATDIN